MRAKAIGAARRRRCGLPLIVGLCAAGAGLVGQAAAAPLAKEACDALKSEQVALISTGLRADMARGAAWAKSNLGAERLKKIARLIEVDEQVLFRCPAPPPELEATAKPAPAAAPKPKPKAASSKQAAPDAGGALEPQAATVPEKSKKASKAAVAAEKKRSAAAAKAKIKAEDAFVPAPDAPISTLQPPAKGGQPKAQ